MQAGGMNSPSHWDGGDVMSHCVSGPVEGIVATSLSGGDAHNSSAATLNHQ